MKIYLFILGIQLTILYLSIKAQVELELEIFNYINLNSYNKDSKTCEYFSNIDKCDPSFILCLSSTKDKKCDILQDKKEFQNQDKIDPVFTKKIQMKTIPKEFFIEVKIDEIDSNGKDVEINDFQININPIINDEKIGYLTPAVTVKDLSLQYRFKFKCLPGYFGASCQLNCRSYQSTNESTCLLMKCESNCKNGQCIVSNQTSIPKCTCYPEWKGPNCSVSADTCLSDFCMNSTMKCNKHNLCSCPSHPNYYCFQSEKNTSVPKVHIQKSNNYLTIIAILIVIVSIGFFGFLILTFWKRYRNSSQKNFANITFVSANKSKSIEDIQSDILICDDDDDMDESNVKYADDRNSI